MACAVAAVLGTGCSSSTGSPVASSVTPASPGGSSSAATGSASGTKPAVCGSVAGLKDAIAGLKDISVSASGLTAISAQLTKIQQELAKVKSDAQGLYQPQAEAVSNAATRLETSLGNAKASLNAGTITAVAVAVGSLVAAGTNLVTSVTQTC
jgi:hypothetical protein